MLIDLTALLCGISQGCVSAFSCVRSCFMFAMDVSSFLLLHFKFLYLVSFRLFSHFMLFLHPSPLCFLLFPVLGNASVLEYLVPRAASEICHASGPLSPFKPSAAASTAKSNPPTLRGQSERARGKPKSERLGGRWKRSLLSSPRVTGRLRLNLLANPARPTRCGSGCGAVSSTCYSARGLGSSGSETLGMLASPL